MNFSMAVWMQQYTIVGLITATIHSPNYVVIVPPSLLGACLTADRTETLLLFPQIKQLPAPFEVVCHLHAEAFFKVHFPCRVIRVCLTLDFAVTFDRHAGRVQSLDALWFPFLAFSLTADEPVFPCDVMQVLRLHPSLGFLWMSAGRPWP